MKKMISALLTLIATTTFSQNHSLHPLWETDSVIAIPESVMFTSGDYLYISAIDGAPWVADGKGAIVKMNKQTKSLQHDWITGLNAPKGMAISGNNLYVADMKEVVVIDMNKGKIIQKILIDSAKGLNDVSISPDQKIYVTDSQGGKIWVIQNGKATLYLDNMRGVNGIKAIGNEVFIGAGRQFLKAGPDKTITNIAQVSQGIDGIEPVGNGDFILTAWIGHIFYVNADGSVQTILETHAQKKHTADIGYDPATKTLYVPTFGAKTVAAYEVR